ncbi:MAG: hypothetical protein M3069_00625 [Chloroflexota bacterium]|nr:hypothetical protein [Chloroflexota bacterium]
MVALERVMLLAEISVASGGVTVGVLIGVVNGVGSTVTMASAGRVEVGVGELVGTLVRVGMRVAVGVGGSRIRVGMKATDAVGAAEGVGIADAVGETAVLAETAAVEVTAGVGATEGVGVDACVLTPVGVDARVLTPVGDGVELDVAGAGWAKLTWSDAVPRLAAIKTLSTHTSTRRPSTEGSECQCRRAVSIAGRANLELATLGLGRGPLSAEARYRRSRV